MLVTWVLLPVFVLVGLTFAVLLGTARARSNAKSGAGRPRDVGSLFELPMLFYVLIAIAFPLRHTDLVIVMLSWVFVITCFVNAGMLVSSDNAGQRGMAWYAGALVLFAMWVYFALKILFLF
jgi:hypothetical protein